MVNDNKMQVSDAKLDLGAVIGMRKASRGWAWRSSVDPAAATRSKEPNTRGRDQAAQRCQDNHSTRNRSWNKDRLLRKVEETAVNQTLPFIRPDSYRVLDAKVGPRDANAAR